MKKYLFLFVAFSFGLVSCKKSYTCQCLDDVTNLGTRSFEVKAANQNAAEELCASGSSSTDHCFYSY